MNSFKWILFSALLEQLQANNILTQGFRFAVNSVRNITSHIRTFFYFCVFFNLQPLPAAPTTLCYFAELMAITVSYGHIKNILSSTKYLHASYNLKYPENDFNLDTTLQGLKRKLARTPFQVLPLTPSILRKLYKFLNMEKTEDLALWVSYLTAF